MKNAIKSKPGITGMSYLVQSTTMTYFSPSGKARLGTKTTYHVYADMDMADGQESDRSRFHFATKSEAIKYFKSL